MTVVEGGEGSGFFFSFFSLPFCQIPDFRHHFSVLNRRNQHQLRTESKQAGSGSTFSTPALSTSSDQHPPAHLTALRRAISLITVAGAPTYLRCNNVLL